MIQVVLHNEFESRIGWSLCTLRCSVPATVSIGQSIVFYLCITRTGRGGDRSYDSSENLPGESYQMHLYTKLLSIFPGEPRWKSYIIPRDSTSPILGVMVRQGDTLSSPSVKVCIHPSMINTCPLWQLQRDM